MYLGRSGEHKVMSELLLRGYNVAHPGVDVGEDIFVISGCVRQVWPVQVKTSTAAKRQNGGYASKFVVPEKQLFTEGLPDLIYVFCAMFEGAWVPTVIIPRAKLRALYTNAKLSRYGENPRGLNFRFHHKVNEHNEGKLFFCGQDITSYIENWSLWPRIEGNVTPSPPLLASANPLQLPQYPHPNPLPLGEGDLFK
jgi:hypothetical protein